MISKHIRSQAHRKLKHAYNYTNEVKYIPAPLEDQRNDILGVYMNKGNENIYITTHGLYLDFNGGRFILFKEITQAAVVAEDKTKADKIVVALDGEQYVSIPVTGGKGKIRDVWVFLTFIDYAAALFEK